MGLGLLRFDLVRGVHVREYQRYTRMMEWESELYTDLVIPEKALRFGESVRCVRQTCQICCGVAVGFLTGVLHR